MIRKGDIFICNKDIYVGVTANKGELIFSKGFKYEVVNDVMSLNYVFLKDNIGTFRPFHIYMDKHIIPGFKNRRLILNKLLNEVK